MSQRRNKIGVIGVDAGICWIGDPCYILHQEVPPEAIGKDWVDFCNRLQGDSTQFNYRHGSPLGVVVSTGYGDGVYPVYAEYKDGRIARVTIEFMEEEE